ncbi:MAG: 3-dehydroquinate synthase [Nitrospirota bacterium]|nr:3-dehydroquinate synthase [Nitrospirota bacterium]
MDNLRVELGERSYDIIIRNGSLNDLGEIALRSGLKGAAAVVTNPLVKRLYGTRATNSLKKAGFKPFFITIPDGERYKNLKSLSVIFDELIAKRGERTTPIIALGGGVIGDLAGFAAATYLRGVPFVQVPTTLLSQVDSSVGGKTGVNHPRGKNLIGAFYQPRVVVIDPEVLKTLAPRELKAGFAEVAKYGVIWDEKFFSFLEEKVAEILTLGSSVTEAIRTSCEIKASVVGSDERESGLRAILNFGHTFGHAIEANAGYGRVKHGEAVAIGMCMAADMAESSGFCKKGVLSRIEGLLKAAGLPVVSKIRISPKDYLKALRIDKKVSAGRLRFVLPTRLGAVDIAEVSEAKITEFFRKKTERKR